MKQTPIGFPDETRKIANENKRPGESLAAYVRRLIHEEHQRRLTTAANQGHQHVKAS